MAFFIISIIVLIVAVGLLIGGAFSEDYKKPLMTSSAIVFILAIGLFVGSFFTSIPTGHTGIVTVFGKVEDRTLDAGINTKAPWAKIVKMDNRIQKATVDLACFSSDIQEVNCKYTINYQIDKTNASEIYRSIGKDYFDTVISPTVAESVKTIMAHYTAENLIGKRDSLASEIETLLNEQLQKYNIKITSTAIEDMDFTDEFTNAVEAKQVAVQNKLKAQTEQEQKTMEAQQQAERAQIEANAQAEVAKIGAQADLEVTKIQADAAEYAGQKEAAKNKAVSEYLTSDLLTYYLIQQWDGKYPTTYMGNDSDITTLISLSNEAKADSPVEANK